MTIHREAAEAAAVKSLGRRSAQAARRQRRKSRSNPGLAVFGSVERVDVLGRPLPALPQADHEIALGFVDDLLAEVLLELAQLGVAFQVP